MRKNHLFLLIVIQLIIYIACAIQKQYKPTSSINLQPLKLTIEDVQNPQMSAKQLIVRISKEHHEEIQSLIRHFLSNKKSTQWSDAADDSVKYKIFDLFGDNKRSSTQDAIQKFMRNKLYAKLQIDTLSQQFKKEIESSPQDYFLTTEMYDLLIGD